MLELARRRFLVGVAGTGWHVACRHDRLDLDRPLGAQQMVERDRAEQMIGGIDDEDLVEAVGQVARSSRMIVDGLRRPSRTAARR